MILYLIVVSTTILCGNFLDLPAIFTQGEKIFYEYEQPGIGLYTNYDAIYSEKMKDSTLTSHKQNSNSFKVILPILKGIQLSGVYTDTKLNSLNSFNSTYVTDSSKIVYQNYLLKIKYYNKLIKCHIAYDYLTAKNSNTFHILKFPQSDFDSRANEYFYDLLPAAFGKSLDYNQDYSKFSQKYYLALQHQYVWAPFVKLTLIHSDNDIKISYLNSSGTRLAGVHNLDFTIPTLSRSYEIGLSNRELNKLSFIYKQKEFKNSINQNDDFNGRDITELSNGSINYESKILKYEYGTSKKGIILTAGYASIRGYDYMSTPVLAYDGFFGIIPISHQVFTETNIDYSVQGLMMWLEKKTSHVRLKPTFAFYHSYLSVENLAEGELEFGLINIDKNSELYYDIQIYQIKLESSYTLKNIKFSIEFSQLIPFVREKTSEGIIQKPVEKKEIDSFGGFSIKSGLSYYF